MKLGRKAQRPRACENSRAGARKAPERSRRHDPGRKSRERPVYFFAESFFQEKNEAGAEACPHKGDDDAPENRTIHGLAKKAGEEAFLFIRLGLHAFIGVACLINGLFDHGFLDRGFCHKSGFFLGTGS